MAARDQTQAQLEVPPSHAVHVASPAVELMPTPYAFEDSLDYLDERWRLRSGGVTPTCLRSRPTDPSGVDDPFAHLDAYQHGAAKPIAPAPGRSYNLSYREIAALEDGMLRARLLASHRDVSFHVLKELRAFARVCTWGGGGGVRIG
jgi:hypothetical protein